MLSLPLAPPVKPRVRMPPMPRKNDCSTIVSSSARGFSRDSGCVAVVDPAVMRKYNKTLGSFLPTIHENEDTATVCIECVETEVFTVQLFNQRCLYFPDCARGNHCKFLHEEAPMSTVFHDGNAPPPQVRTFSVCKTVYKSKPVEVVAPELVIDDVTTTRPMPACM